MKTIFLIFLLLKSFLSLSQNQELLSLRDKYCNKNCEFYSSQLSYVKNLPDFPTREPAKKNKLLKLFNIPLEKRLELFPFSEYDSIYVIKPNYLNDDKEPRDYFNEKYYNTKYLINKKQVKKFSDILFNYYEVNYSNFTNINRKKIGCDCIEREYPQLILLFVNNGKKNYIGFPFYAYNVENKRTSFSEEEFKSLDLDNQKVKKILKYFNAYNDDFFDE
ncbi:MAG: hypothetical protein JNJ52_01750 [Flavobacterium sp.]|nr:hypothetical protein [Flavobacterium sp.]